MKKERGIVIPHNAFVRHGTKRMSVRARVIVFDSKSSERSVEVILCTASVCANCTCLTQSPLSLLVTRQRRFLSNKSNRIRTCVVLTSRLLSGGNTAGAQCSAILNSHYVKWAEMLLLKLMTNFEL